MSLNIKKIWPFPALVFVWEFKNDCEFNDEDILKVTKWGLFDFKIQVRKRQFWFWIERE